MRPQSVVGMIAAAVMLVAGLILCLVASGMAGASDIHLFPVTEGGNTKSRQTAFTDDGITKIEISVSDAKVNIIGGQEESYIELKNFDENRYSYTVSGKTITLTEMQGISSMLKFWENGFAFKGMRNILWSVLGMGEQITGEKVVNLYLSDVSKSLNNVQLDLTDCDVSLQNLTMASDFVLRVNSSTVKAQKVTGMSKLELIASGRLNLEVTDSAFSSLLISSSDDGKKAVPEATISLTDSTFTASDINIESGSVTHSLLNRNPLNGGVECFDFDLSTAGKITFNGKTVASPYTKVGMGATKSKLKIAGGSADITVIPRTE